MKPWSQTQSLQHLAEHNGIRHPLDNEQEKVQLALSRAVLGAKWELQINTGSGHIANGIPNSCGECPIALAIIDALTGQVEGLNEIQNIEIDQEEICLSVDWRRWNIDLKGETPAGRE